MNSIAGPAPRTDRLGRARVAELVLESAADFAVVTTDLDGTITSWNAAAERAMGWPEAEAVGQHASMVFTPEDRAQDVCGREMAEACAEGRAADERWHLRKDGSRFWASGTTTPLVDERTGERLGFLKILRDRTAEHRSGERLRASEALLRGLMENSADCLKLLTPDGRVSSVNAPGLCAMEIADFEAVRGADWASLWPEAERAKLGAALAEARAGRVGRFRGRCPTAKGTPKWWDVQVTPVPGGDGRPELLLASSRDVTEQRRVEEELRRLNGRLEAEAARRAGEMRRQEEALRQSQKLEAMGRLTGGVAHDFNNLLTVIRASADLLRRPGLPEERRARYAEAIADTADRAAKLTAQLLAFARRQPLAPEPFEAGGRVRDLVPMLQTLVGTRVAVEAVAECGGCHVRADLNQFETALVNLAANARDAMGAEGRLTLRVRRAAGVPPTRGHAGAPGAFVAVSVSDTGPGIAPEAMARIFEPFFTTKGVGKGTGLGLSQVHGFAKQSGGEVQVESEAGRGATLTLYLPLAEAGPAAAEDRTVPAAAAAEGRNRRVLLVEDNTEVGAFAERMLDDLGFAATWAPSAASALELLDGGAGRFDVVFSDVVMPGRSGLDLGREVRRRFPDLRVVLTSGYSEALASDGCEGFELLRKPYSAETLSRALRPDR